MERPIIIEATSMMSGSRLNVVRKRIVGKEEIVKPSS